FRFGTGEFCLGLPHTALRIRPGLVGLDLGLLQLRLKRRKLAVCGALSSFTYSKCCAGLIFAGAQLLIVKNGDSVSSLHAVALTKANFCNSPAGFPAQRPAGLAF